MRITVIRKDRWIRRDDDAAFLKEWPFNDSNIHAIQWYDDHGEIELNTPENTPNVKFTDFEILKPYLDALDEHQAWLATDNTLDTAPEPSPSSSSYIAFWDALIASSAYASIRTQSFTSLPMNTLATEFIALLGDAKDGRANEAAIQASIAAILSTGTFTQEDIEEFQAALAIGRIDDIYVLD